MDGFTEKIEVANSKWQHRRVIECSFFKKGCNLMTQVYGIIF